LERGAVEIITYTLQGKAVSRLQKVMDIGAHSIAQPKIGNGVYLYRIKACGIELIVKSPTLGRIAGGAVLSTQGITTTATASRAERYVPIEDTIRVIRDGYLNCRVAVKNSDTSDMVIKMISQDAGTVTDIDGNVYHAIRIGNQVWTVENLRTTRYNDGFAIPLVTDSTAWGFLTTPGYCFYNNTTNADSIKKFGALYNWYAINPANTKKIAPVGWHVPADAEWDTLQNYLIANGYNWDGTTTGNKIAKSLAAKTDWHAYIDPGTIGADLTKNNRSGFSALPGGCRFNNGYFNNIGSNGFWWSATELDASYAYDRFLYYVSDTPFRSNYDKSCGFSIRLLRDN
jgi:uncharacterized protein (TIGR02145 family)